MKKIIFYSSLFLFISNAYAQSMKTRKWRKSENDSLIKAQAFFEEQNYLMALPIFEKIQKNHPKESYLKYVMAICGLYRSDLHEQALEFLEEVYPKNKNAISIKYDYALAYHLNYKFDDAIRMLNEYLEDKTLTEKQKQEALLLINYAKNGKILVAKPVDAKIENVGDVVNTEAYEYVPVISSDESVMIFTYRGEKSEGGLRNSFGQVDSFGTYYEDVFISHKQNSNWFTPTSIGTNINTVENDAAIGVSNDGQKLFVYRDDRYDGGDIYISKLDSTTWSAPERLLGEVNSRAWEGSASITADEKTLYFSSERAGGFGGRDLYRATLMSDGVSWGNITNLGSAINTSLDDDAPFIHPDGQTLIYSSKGLNSMGSYDIFMSELNVADSSWSMPQNLGYPINTTDDDRYFVLSADGSKGYYASGKSGGYGLHDIYSVTMPNDFFKPAIIMVKGTVTQNNSPTKASIQVDMIDNNKPYGNFQSNAIWGNYLINLMPNHNYKLTYKLKGYEDKILTVDTRALKGYQTKMIDIKFDIPKDSTAVISPMLASVKTDVPQTHSLKPVTTPSKPVVSPAVLPTVTPNIANAVKEGLEFKIQIAAYSLPKNYNPNYLKGLGKIEKLVLEDGITRFTIGGSFKTLNEAIAHRDKVQKAGQSDAFVTAIYKGKRIYLKDLEQLGVTIPSEK